MRGGSAGIRTDEGIPERENYIFMMTMQQMRNIMYVFAVFADKYILCSKVRIFLDHEKMRSITIRMTRQKLKRFHVKRIYSTLLLSYGALLAAPFIAVFLLLSFWKNSTENYYSEIMKNDLTEGRMAFEKQLDIMCAGAFSVSNDSDLKWVYFLDGLKDGDNNIAALIRCNDMLRQTFADSEHYQNYSVIMKMN